MASGCGAAERAAQQTKALARDLFEVRTPTIRPGEFSSLERLARSQARPWSAGDGPSVIAKVPRPQLQPGDERRKRINRVCALKKLHAFALPRSLVIAPRRRSPHTVGRRSLAGGDPRATWLNKLVFRRCRQS